MTHRWYVIRSKPCKEEFLAEQMELRQIEIFNPRIRVQTVNPRARKVKPYFLPSIEKFLILSLFLGIIG